MATISTSDLIFATVANSGTVLANLRMSGLTSFDDIIREVRSQIGAVGGLSTISVRNSSRGWSATQTVMFR